MITKMKYKEEWSHIMGLTIKLSFFALIVWTLPAVSNLSTCEPSEERRQTVLIHRIKIQNIKYRLQWYQDSRHVSYCQVNGTCIDILGSNYIATVSVDKNNYFSNLTLLSISRKDEGEWSVRLDGDANKAVKICSLKVFARPKNMTCRVELLTSWLTSSCTADQVYPYGLCQHSLTLNKNTKLHLSSTKTNVSICSGEPEYCETNCSARIFSGNLTVGAYAWIVNMYPNVTGTQKDLNFSSSWKYTFNIDQPEIILIDCPNIIQQGQMVTCLCNITSSNGILPTTVEWFKNNTLVSLGSESAILNLNSSNICEEFTCRARNILNMTGNPVTYKPKSKRSHRSMLMIVLILAGISGLLVLCVIFFWKRKVILSTICFYKRGIIQGSETKEKGIEEDIIEDNRMPNYYEIELLKPT